MLARLGRWLRAAGYDTVIAKGGVPDRELTVCCAEEDRVLLTRDRHLFAVAGDVARVILVPEDRIDRIAIGLRDTLKLDWQHAPFTRCLVDNRVLKEAPPELAVRVPARSRTADGPLLVCPDCGRLYWPGGHVHRMQQRLAAWQHLARLHDPR